MIKIHENFTGGNIKVLKQDGDCLWVDNNLRDTTMDWFYWAFCVEGAENKTLTFNFRDTRLGYFGPAVSHDLVNWYWLDSINGDSFTYTFGENESKVYFAHSMLYHPDRFYAFCNKNNIEVKELCIGYKGSSVPYITFGNGDKTIILTSRHHACESSGDFVLEGVLEELISNPIDGVKIVCVPFVDFDGVISGDQGKGRAPFDHNRDYNEEKPSIYPETTAIKELAKNGICMAFDFHSPWHKGGIDDEAFIVQNSFCPLENLNRFGEILENEITVNSFKYSHSNDYPPETKWNVSGPQFSNYMARRANIAFSFETAYFGTESNKVTNDRLLEFGHCFARAIKKYIETI